MREVGAKSREIQDYYSAVTMKSSGDISADPLQTTAHGPNPAREDVLSKMKKQYIYEKLNLV